MRRLTIVAVAALLAVSAAHAQPAPAPKVPPVQPAKPAPKPPPPIAAPPAYVGPSVPLRSPLPNSAADAAQAQCSATCGRVYYLCLAGDNADLCSGDWAQCRVRCGAASRRPAG